MEDKRLERRVIEAKEIIDDLVVEIEALEGTVSKLESTIEDLNAEIETLKEKYGM